MMRTHFSKYTGITAEQERETMEKIREGSGRTDLLEQLSARMGCQYLSDLRGTKRKVQCRAVLVEIPAEEYTTETWNDAIYYITGEKTKYSTPAEAKKELIMRLE
ncbi:hypothetical protein DW876_00015 [Hungatella hathewayi]|jgi:hypothetical protein|nr:hypothetical protein DW876_00015 [Hungatella hathewayi]